MFRHRRSVRLLAALTAIALIGVAGRGAVRARPAYCDPNTSGSDGDQYLCYSVPNLQPPVATSTTVALRWSLDPGAVQPFDILVSVGLEGPAALDPDQTSFTVTGLTPNRTYAVSVCSDYGDGYHACADSSVMTNPAAQGGGAGGGGTGGTPQPPTVKASVAGPREIVVSWQTAAPAQSLDVKRYRQHPGESTIPADPAHLDQHWCSDSAACTPIAAGATRIDDTGVLPSGGYLYAVTVTPGGSGSTGALRTPSELAQPTITAVAQGGSAVPQFVPALYGATIHWRANEPTNLADRLVYTVQRDGATISPQLAPADVAVPNDDDAWVDVGPLAPGGSFAYTVCVLNPQDGDQQCSAAAGFATGGVPTITSVSHAPGVDGGALVAWTFADNADDVRWYEVQRDGQPVSPHLDINNCACTAGVFNPNPVTWSVPWTDPGPLKPGQTYSYRVCAGNDGGEVCSAEAISYTP